MDRSFDVAVAGGGPAGIAAAISAATAGAQTLLIERSDILGGNAGNALVHTICGLYLPDRDVPVYANDGFPRLFAETLRLRGAAAPAEKAGRVQVLPTYPHRLAVVARDLCSEQAGLTVWCNATLVRAQVDDCGFVLDIERGGRTAHVRAPLAIDTTGDANLAALAGAECMQESADQLQTPSFIFRVRGVAVEETEGFARLRLSNTAARAARNSELPSGAGSILLRPGPAPGEAYITLNVARPSDRPYSPLDEQFLNALTDEARHNAQALVDYLRRHRAGFAACEVIEWPRRIGVRETRRVAGVETLVDGDILNGRRRDDEVALSTWPIELWHSHKGARYLYPEAASSIPLGALISRASPRLGMAGRCMSASHEALGALRVIGTALATGEAVGRAAALAADRGATLCEIPVADITVARRPG